MQNPVTRISLCFFLLLALYPHTAFSQQATPPSPLQMVQSGARSAVSTVPPIPPGSRPPDQVFRTTNTAGIGALAFSPDGQWLASAGYGDTIMIWNAATGAEHARLAWPASANSAVLKLAFSPDGSRLAAAGFDGKVRTWDLEKGALVYSAQLRGGRMDSFAFGPDGKVWAASSFPADSATVGIEIHDANTGKTLRTIPTKWFGLAGLTITKEGMLVASGTTTEDVDDEHDSRGTVQTWELASGKPVKTSSVFSVIGPISPDGRWMANIGSGTQGAGSVAVTDLSTGQVKWTLEQKDANLIFFSPDAQEIAVTYDGAAPGWTVWSLATGAKLSSAHDAQNPNEPTELHALAFKPGGKQIAVANYPVSSVKTWDVTSGGEVREFAAQYSVLTVVASPDGRWLVSTTPALTVRNPADGKIVTTLTSLDADMLVFSPDGRWLAANPGVFPGTGRSLVVWDTKTWAVVASVTPELDPLHGAPVQWIGFGGEQSPHSQLGNAQSLQFRADGKTHVVWYSFSPMAVSPDGKLLAQLGQPLNNVDLWDTTSGQKIRTIAAHKMITNFVVFSHDGRWLLTSGQETRRMLVDAHTYQGTTEFKIKQWDTGTWEERVSVSYPQMLSASPVLAPDGMHVALERAWGMTEYLDLEHGKSLGPFFTAVAAFPFGPILGKGNLAFSSDGTLLFEGAFKNGTYVWKLGAH